MKTLETQFIYAGHLLRQIWRSGDVAVFERGFPNRAPHALELVLIKIKPQKRLPNGKILPEHEAYPSSSKWGTYGFSIPIRYKDSVLELAQKVAAIREHRVAFIKQAVRQMSPS